MTFPISCPENLGHVNEQTGYTLDTGIRPDFVALDNPTFVSSKEAVHLHEDDKVVAANLNGQSKAYSLKPAAHHHMAWYRRH